MFIGFTVLMDDEEDDEEVEAAEEGVEPVELFDCISFAFLLDDPLLCLFDFVLPETVCTKLLFGLAPRALRWSLGVIDKDVVEFIFKGEFIEDEPPPLFGFRFLD
jgi:hypothetical protein